MEKSLYNQVVSDLEGGISVKEYPISDVYPEHWHLFGEIIYAQESGGVFRVQGETYHLDKGETLIIWPTELHCPVALPEKENIILQFSSEFIQHAPDIIRFYRSMQSVHKASLNTTFQNSMEKKILEISAINKSADDFRFSRMVSVLYQMLIEIAEEARNHRVIAGRFGERAGRNTETYLKIQTACGYIADHCEKDLMQKEVADQIGFSAYYFSRVFKKYTGKSYSEYLTMQRIRKAVEMLSSDNVPITEVGFLSGFQSVSNFNRAFRSVMHCSPTQFRRMRAAESPGTWLDMDNENKL